MTVASKQSYQLPPHLQPTHKDKDKRGNGCARRAVRAAEYSRQKKEREARQTGCAERERERGRETERLYNLQGG